EVVLQQKGLSGTLVRHPGAGIKDLLAERDRSGIASVARSWIARRNGDDEMLIDISFAVSPLYSPFSVGLTGGGEDAVQAPVTHRLKTAWIWDRLDHYYLARLGPALKHQQVACFQVPVRVIVVYLPIPCRYHSYHFIVGHIVFLSSVCCRLIVPFHSPFCRKASGYLSA